MIHKPLGSVGVLVAGVSSAPWNLIRHFVGFVRYCLERGNFQEVGSQVKFGSHDGRGKHVHFKSYAGQPHPL